MVLAITLLLGILLIAVVHNNLQRRRRMRATLRRLDDVPTSYLTDHIHDTK